MRGSPFKRTCFRMTIVLNVSKCSKFSKQFPLTITINAITINHNLYSNSIKKEKIFRKILKMSATENP